MMSQAKVKSGFSCGHYASKAAGLLAFVAVAMMLCGLVMLGKNRLSQEAPRDLEEVHSPYRGQLRCLDDGRPLFFLVPQSGYEKKFLFEEAEEACRSRSGTLALLKTPQLLAEAIQVLGPAASHFPVWIGLRPTREKCSGDECNGFLTWVDQSAFYDFQWDPDGRTGITFYHNLHPGQVDNHMYSYVLYMGKVVSLRFLAALPALCQARCSYLSASSQPQSVLAE